MPVPAAAVTNTPRPPRAMPTQPVPVYVGGGHLGGVKRAARLGDGWIGTLYQPDAAQAKVGELKGYLGEQGRADDDFEIALSLFARDDLDLFRRMHDIAVTRIIHAPWLLAQPGEGRDVRSARLDAIRRFAETYIAPLTVG